ncbi:glycosyltransferase [Pseudonocardiaceae bacterium YIM PH 21723]|nr:glycosyltransferase [Pseudonocardiaceae bacterium YIM PH 21723]
MSVAFITYVIMIIIPYLRYKARPTGDPAAFSWHFIVPCRDEEAVIQKTIDYLRTTFPQAHVWVIDDDSDDRTAGVVRSMRRNGGNRDENIHLVERVRPYARTGKGDALNAAYRELREFVGFMNPHRCVVVVVDADGRPSPNALEVCSAKHLFGDSRIGAVQMDVRMVNRDVPEAGARGFRRWFGMGMVRMQDLEFRTAISAIQMSRGYTGTIAMGGNGQFTRLSALDSIAGGTGSPWRGSLLEDFELGVHLLTEGWHTGYTRDAWVDQEALYSLRRFLAQRTRWGQGTMQCMRYAPRIWDSKHLTTIGAAEMMYYLLQPWMQLLGTMIYPIPFVLLGIRTWNEPAAVATWFTDGAWILFAVYGLFGLLPFLVWGPIYWWKCERKGSFFQSLLWGLGYATYIYTFYITSWRAMIRLLRGQNGWAKTRRNTEEKVRGAVVALDH